MTQAWYSAPPPGAIYYVLVVASRYKTKLAAQLGISMNPHYRTEK